MRWTLWHTVVIGAAVVVNLGLLAHGTGDRRAAWATLVAFLGYVGLNVYAFQQFSRTLPADASPALRWGAGLAEGINLGALAPVAIIGVLMAILRLVLPR